MLKMLREALRKGGAEDDRAAHARSGPGPRFRGKVEIDFARCTLDGACAEACPTPSIRIASGGSTAGTGDRNAAHARSATFTLDLGPCIFCGLCEEACPEGALRLTPEFALASRRREDLVTRGQFGAPGEPPPRARASKSAAAAGAGASATSAPTAASGAAGAAGQALRNRAIALLGRALNVRVVDAGSCNGCESEIRSAADDLSRFGIELVSTARHADLLLVTGPVTLGMERALLDAYGELGHPRLVVALGACAIGGGIHAGAYAQSDGLPPEIPADVFVPGCPPRPEAILHGLLLALGRAEQKVRAGTWQGPWPDARS